MTTGDAAALDRRIAERLLEIDGGIIHAIRFGSSVYSPGLADDVDIVVITGSDPKSFGIEVTPGPRADSDSRSKISQKFDEALREWFPETRFSCFTNKTVMELTIGSPDITPGVATGIPLIVSGQPVSPDADPDADIPTEVFGVSRHSIAHLAERSIYLDLFRSPYYTEKALRRKSANLKLLYAGWAFNLLFSAARSAYYAAVLHGGVVKGTREGSLIAPLDLEAARRELAAFKATIYHREIEKTMPELLDNERLREDYRSWRAKTRAYIRSMVGWDPTSRR